MKRVVGIATFKGREKSLDTVVKCLSSQVDEIIIYDNEVNPDLADNGKFYGLTLQEEPCYYFTCDDDLFYPEDYIDSMVKAIDKHNCIVTHHGRLLMDLDVSYYRGHKSFRCLDFNSHEMRIDVCGTGVTGFRTDYFNPVGLHNSEHKKMSDIVFSLEAVKRNKDIMVLPHNAGWIKHLPINFRESIAATESRNESTQIQLANEIYNIRYGY